MQPSICCMTRHIGPPMEAGYQTRAHYLCGPVATPWLFFAGSLWAWIAWLFVAIFFRVIVAMNRRGYFWLSVAIFWGRGYFFSRGHFCSFFVAIFLKCRKYRQKIAAWLFFVCARGYFSWLSVAIRGYPWLFFVFVAISNIPWLFFSWLFFWTAVNSNILAPKK